MEEEFNLMEVLPLMNVHKRKSVPLAAGMRKAGVHNSPFCHEASPRHHYFNPQ